MTPQREPSGRRSRTTEFWGTLRVDVLDDEIVVSLPGTSYTVTYFKRPNSPQLLAKNIFRQVRILGATLTGIRHARLARHVSSPIDA